MRSLRLRLLATTALGMTAVIACAGAVLHGWMDRTLTDALDRALLEKARALSAQIEQDDHGIELDLAEADPPEFRRAERPEYLQVWSAAGEVLYRSASLNGGDLVPLPPPGAFALALPDQRPGRLAVLRFRPRLDEPGPSASAVVTLALAADVRDVRATLAQLRAGLLLVGAAAVLLSAVALAWLVGVGLRPARDLASRIAGIDVRSLRQTLDAARVPRELRPLVEHLNLLLMRLDQALQREKAMTADVAHELRTPLAGLRTTLEVAAARPREAPALQSAVTACLRITQQMHSIVENLLMMARLEAGALSSQASPLDMSALVHGAWQEHEAAARAKRLGVRRQIAAGAWAVGDEASMRVVLRNLLENAVEYCDEGGTLRLELDHSADHVCLAISNSGCSLAPADVPHVFERFWRAESARASRKRCGIGLSLCRLLVGRMNGEIGADVSGGVFTMRVTLASASADARSARGDELARGSSMPGMRAAYAQPDASSARRSK